MLPISAICCLPEDSQKRGLFSFPEAGMGSLKQKKTALSVFPEGPFFCLKIAKQAVNVFPFFFC